MFALAIHGGAGTILKSQLTPDLEASYHNGLNDALRVGAEILKSGGSALDAVAAAVVSLENCPLFNAGKGSVFTYDEKHEMDASIMNGVDLSCGAVAGVYGIKNPVLLARAVMEHTDFVLLSGKGAIDLAKSRGVEIVSEDYFYTEHRHRQWKEVHSEGGVSLDHREEKKFGTVGAVALDRHGNLSAATSTGGMTNKRYGRIGDTPVIGSGTYAKNKTCAVSCTGHGEYFLRQVVAYDISCLMEYRGLSLQQACEVVVHDKLVKTGGEGGLIALDQSGNPVLCFNSDGMYRGLVKEGGQPETAIYK